MKPEDREYEDEEGDDEAGDDDEPLQPVVLQLLQEAAGKGVGGYGIFRNRLSPKK